MSACGCDVRRTMQQAALEDALHTLDECRNSVKVLLQCLVPAASDSRLPPDAARVLAQKQILVERFRSSLSASRNNVDTLQEKLSTEPVRGILQRARAAYARDAAEIEPVAKRQRTAPIEPKKIQLPKRLPASYKPSFTPPTDDSTLVNFLVDVRSRAPDLDVATEAPKQLLVTLHAVLKARLALKENEGALHVDRLVIFGLGEDIPLHGTSAYAVFRTATSAHDRPCPLEETLSRLAALRHLFTTPCSKLTCRKVLSPVPFNELPVERILRSEGAGTPSFDAFHRACWASEG